MDIRICQICPSCIWASTSHGSQLPLRTRTAHHILELFPILISPLHHIHVLPSHASISCFSQSARQPFTQVFSSGTAWASWLSSVSPLSCSPLLHLQRLALTELSLSLAAGQFTAWSHDPRVQALGSRLGSRSNGSEGRGEGGGSDSPIFLCG